MNLTFSELLINLNLDGIEENLTDFIKLCLVITPPSVGVQIPLKVLFNAYLYFCYSKNQVPLSYKKFRIQFIQIFQRLEQADLFISKVRSIYIIFNVCLKDSINTIKPKRNKNNINFSSLGAK